MSGHTAEEQAWLQQNAERVENIVAEAKRRAQKSSVRGTTPMDILNFYRNEWMDAAENATKTENMALFVAQARLCEDAMLALAMEQLTVTDRGMGL